jgi:hypothetical protein
MARCNGRIAGTAPAFVANGSFRARMKEVDKQPMREEGLKRIPKTYERNGGRTEHEAFLRPIDEPAT